MRLLQLLRGGNFSLVEFFGKDIPPYAILSHTWGDDSEEVTIEDLRTDTGKNKKGFEKLLFCRQQAISNGLQFIWVDTCCIDKSSSAELSEAINSMFVWYHRATECYVYLSDVVVDLYPAEFDAAQKQSFRRSWSSSFLNSRWFTRGWTLQELLAPASVDFFSANGYRLGSKISLVQEIHEATGISIQAIRGHQLSEFTVDERLSWAKQRVTKRDEDAAYCLLGIFGIHIPAIYGEGRDHAIGRLRRKIVKSSSPQQDHPQTSPDTEWFPQRQQLPPTTAATKEASAEAKLHEEEENNILREVSAEGDLPCPDNDTQSSQDSQSPNQPQPRNTDIAGQEPGEVGQFSQYALWTLKKDTREGSWSGSLVQHRMRSHLINNTLELFKARNYSVPKVLGKIWPDKARTAMDNLLAKQNLDLARRYPGLRWKIAAIDLEWQTAVDNRWRELVTMNIVLEIGPSSRC